MRWCCCWVLLWPDFKFINRTVAQDHCSLRASGGIDWAHWSACNLWNPNWIIESFSKLNVSLSTVIQSRVCPHWDILSGMSRKGRPLEATSPVCVARPGKGPGDLWYPGTGYQQLGRVLVAAKMVQAAQAGHTRILSLSLGSQWPQTATKPRSETWPGRPVQPALLPPAAGQSCQGVFAPK